MAALIRECPQSKTFPMAAAAGAGAMVAVAGIVFLLLPGDVGEKSHLALQGICAQRPSHSLQFGGRALPLDARMTGIYLGAATMLGWLALAGRLRYRGRIPRPIAVTLALFFLTMALDGFDGLAVDLQLPHPYEPSNPIRLATGLLCGVALGVALGHTFAITVWTRTARQQAVIDRFRELLPPLLIAGSLAGIALSGLPILYSPLAVMLVCAAIATIWMACVIVATLGMGHAWQARTYQETGAAPFVAVVMALGFMGLTSLLRQAAESWLGLPKFT